MDKNPLITVAIPSFNHGKYLPSLFQSILDQDYDNISILLSDDGSTDNTREVVREWFPKLKERFNFNYHFHLHNFGDKAWSNCKYLTKLLPDEGYIQFCESDDYFKPNKLSKQVAFLKENPDFGAVHSDVIAEFEDGSYVDGFWKHNRHLQTGGDPIIPSGFIRSHLLKCNFIYTCSLLVRADLYKKHYTHDRFLELGTGFGDYAFFLSLSKETKIGYLEEPLSVYRVLGNSLSHGDSSNREWMIRSTARIQELARKDII
jgi:glycosyltransferase involved in cell wall biosynthesis